MFHPLEMVVEGTTTAATTGLARGPRRVQTSGDCLFCVTDTVECVAVDAGVVLDSSERDRKRINVPDGTSVTGGNFIFYYEDAFIEFLNGEGYGFDGLRVSVDEVESHLMFLHLMWGSVLE